MFRCIAIVNGIVYTASSNNIAEAVVIDKGKIVYIGSSSNAICRAKNCKIIDAEGHLITPGFIDSHCHLAQAGFLEKYGINLLQIRSINQIIDIISEKARKTKPGNWIYGYGLDENLLKEGRPPLRYDLDEATSKHPVFLEHISGHMAVVNSYALKIAGITKDTPNPPGGIIERDERGEPIGILKDSAMSLVTRFMPEPSIDMWMKCIEIAQYMWISKGITAIEDVGLLGQGYNILEAYSRLAHSSRLIIRTRFSYPISSSKELNKDLIKKLKSINSRFLRVLALKIFYDGSGLARTALMHDNWCREYKVDKDSRGLRLIPQDDLISIIHLANKEDLRVSIHAIGDKAIDEVVEAISIAKMSYKAQHSIIHCIVPTKKSIEIMAKLGIGVKTQTSFIYSYGHVYAANLCLERAKKAFPIKTFLRKGIIVGNGSDAPFLNPPDPGYGLYGAIIRKPKIKTPYDDPFGSEERISFIDAVKTYTYLASMAIGWNDEIGSIKIGNKADLVIWNIKTLNPSSQDLLHLKPLATFIEGDIVYVDRDWEDKLSYKPISKTSKIHK